MTQAFRDGGGDAHLRPTAAFFRSDFSNRNIVTNIATAARSIDPVMWSMAIRLKHVSAGAERELTKIPQMPPVRQLYPHQLASLPRPALIVCVGEDLPV